MNEASTTTCIFQLILFLRILLVLLCFRLLLFLSYKAHLASMFLELWRILASMFLELWRILGLDVS